MLQDLNVAIAYIEDHLTDDLLIENVAQVTTVSDYHFRKLFYFLTGMPLSEYIKKRKLSQAHVDLSAGERVTDVAFKYGYQSVEGFTRAFKQWATYLPSEVKMVSHQKTFPPLTFAIQVKGGTDMEFRIEEKAAFNFAGVTKRVPMQFEGVNNEIVALAQSITSEQKEELHALRNVAPLEIVNVSYDADENFLEEAGMLTHMIGVLTTATTAEHLTVKPVPALTWAVFPAQGAFPEVLQTTMARIYSEWLPASNYELVPAPNFSFTKHDEQASYSEIWIAVQERN